MKSLLILLPVYRNVPGPAFNSMMSLVKNAPQHFEFNYLIHTGSYIPVARNILLRAAYTRQPDYVLCIDVDQVFTYYDVLNLIKHYDENDYDLLSADITIRDARPKSLSRSMAYDIDNDGHTTFKTLSQDQFTKVDGTGFGFLLMSGTVLKKIVKGFEGDVLFDTKIESKFMDRPFKYVGEDVWFFRRLKKLGINVAIDNNIHVGHYGFIY